MKKVKWSRVWLAAAPGMALVVFAWLHLWLIQPLELDQSYADRICAKNVKLVKRNGQLRDMLIQRTAERDTLDYAMECAGLQRMIEDTAKLSDTAAAW